MQFRTIILFLSFLMSVFSVHAEVNFKQSQNKPTKMVNQLDLNTVELSKLIGAFKGIGKKRAQAIIAYREQHKGFKSIEEFAEVKGLGPHFVAVNRDKLKEIFLIR